MKKLLIVAVLVIGGVWFYGRSLPREHHVKSTVTVVANPDTVWRMVRSIGSSHTWWDDVKSTRPITGRRETWEQNMGPQGLVTVEVKSVTDGQRLVTEIVPNEEASDSKLSWGGTWTYRVFQTSSGTAVEITEDGFADPPFTRIYMKLRGRYRTVDSYLSSLAAHFGEQTSPRHGS